MSHASAAHTHPSRLGWKSRLVLALSAIWLAPTLACGSFAPRPTPTPSPEATLALPASAATADTGAAAGTPAAQQTPFIVQDPPTPAPAAALTSTLPTTGTAPVAATTPAPLGGSVLAVGQPARITAPNGLNLRSAPTGSGTLIVQLGTGQLVTLLEGPTQAEGYTWWRIDAGSGQTGWVAQGDQETVWLSPQVGAPQPVDRAPRVGERVVVSTQLSVRATPGTSATLMVQVNPNTQYTVLAGPQAADGMNWYQIRSDDGTIQGWVAEGDGTTRWLSPLE